MPTKPVSKILDQRIDTWIKIKDFEETALWINGRNSTTDVPIKKTKNLSISEISDHSVVLTLPKKSCSQGHVLTLTFIKGKKLSQASEKPDPKIAFSVTVTAKVVSVETVDSGLIAARLQLYQFNHDQWNQLLSELILRQQRFQDTFKKIRGVDE